MRKHFGANLRCARRAARLTQRELGAQAGLMPYFISNLENGHRTCSLEHAILLARALGIPLGDLVDPPAAGKTCADPLRRT